MGKKGGSSSSWLTAVKRAFRSPSKDSPDKNRRRVDHDLQEDNDDKKREKRRWIFRKLSVANHESVNQLNQAATASGTDNAAAAAENAIAMAVATAAAAEAAVATVQAAVEVARLTTPPTFSAREYYAAIVIQTAFRGYLARRALRALKGLVKLQALVRGHNVRKQAKMTLRCMQALVRVQSRILDQRMRLSHEDISRKSAFSDTTSLIESRYLRDISDRRSMSREVCSIPDDWDEKPHTVEEVKAMLQQRKEAAAAAAALKRERTLSQAFSQQAMRSGRRQSFGNEEELHERTQRAMDHWGSARTLRDNSSSSSKARASTDHRESIKTVEVDTSQPYTYQRRPNTQNQYHQQQQRTSSPSRQPNHRPSSPLHRANQTTPSPSKTRPIQVRSASPRCVRDDRSYASSQTPSLRSNYQYNGYLRMQQGRGSAHNITPTLPNYMAATESAKARLRSQSAPRQRPSTPERDRIGTAKKRLSYPAPDPYNCYGQGNNYLRSPSFKSVSCSHFGGLEQQSNYSSCCTESLGGEASPTSTSDLRRWLR